MEELKDKAIYILQETNDGEDLAPEHLKLVENAVNGFLTLEGEEDFQKLCEQVQQGYEKPYFHGIEGLTIDLQGYVYWKSQRVEHYNQPWAYSEEGYKAAQELAKRCRKLEAEGEKVCFSNIIELADREG